MGGTPIRIPRFVMVVIVLIMVPSFCLMAEASLSLNLRLNRAVVADDEELVVKLLAAGADPLAADMYGQSPLSLAVDTGAPFWILRHLIVGNLDPVERLRYEPHLWRIYSGELELLLASSVELDTILQAEEDAMSRDFKQKAQKIIEEYRAPLEALAELQPYLWETDAEFEKRISSEQYLIESDRDYQLQRLSLKTWDAYDQATARWQALADMTTAKLAQIRTEDLPVEALSALEFDRNSRQWPLHIIYGQAPLLIDLTIHVDLSQGPDVRSAIMAFDEARREGRLRVTVGYTIVREQAPLNHRVKLLYVNVYDVRDFTTYAIEAYDLVLSEFSGSDSTQAIPCKEVKPDFRLFATGDQFTYMVDEDGVLFVAGDNEEGQLGLSEPSMVIDPIPLVEDVAAIAAGSVHAFVLLEDGTLWATGFNGDGRLGDWTWEDRYELVLVEDSIAAVSAGDESSAYISTDGSLWTVGSNLYGQLGRPDVESDTLGWVYVMDEVASVSVGGYHVLAVTQDGSLWGWGANEAGQLGDGTFTDRPEPVWIMDDVKAVSSGWEHSLVLKNDGTLWAMGLNSYGQLGDGSLEDKNDPVYVADDVVAFSAGRYAHSMFITSDGSLWGMGANDDGQLGDGTLQEQDVPVKILEHAKAVSCGAYHTIVMLDDGSFLAAGDNSSGQFGNSSTEGSSTFIPIDWGF